jgi:hypothetical protein
MPFSISHCQSVEELVTAADWLARELIHQTENFEKTRDAHACTAAMAAYNDLLAQGGRILAPSLLRLFRPYDFPIVPHPHDAQRYWRSMASHVHNSLTQLVRLLKTHESSSA